MKTCAFTRLKFFSAALALCVLHSVALARDTKLVDPDPVTIACDLSAANMRKAIVVGGSKRGWRVVSQDPENTVLKYVKGNNKHILWVNVSYTTNTFSVTYKDSFNLNYTVPGKDDVNDEEPIYAVAEGVPRIHPRAVGWMTNLSGDIEGAVQVLCFE